MKKIKYEPLRDEKHALEKEIEIWTILTQSKDGTEDTDVKGNDYYNASACCEFINNKYGDANDDTCRLCPIYNVCQVPLQTNDDNIYCPFYRKPTAANAQAVLNQLKQEWEKRYGV